MPDHAATKRYLAQACTVHRAARRVLRQHRPLLGQALQTGGLVAPADGPVSWTARTDLAQVAAITFTDDSRLGEFSPAS